MFKRALRLGLVVRNPVTGIPKHKEPGGRIVYLTAADEDAILETLAENLRPMLLVALNTGLRWSEQQRLMWGDVDLLTGSLTIRFPSTVIRDRSRRMPRCAKCFSTSPQVASARRIPRSRSSHAHIAKPPSSFPRPSLGLKLYSGA